MTRLEKTFTPLGAVTDEATVLGQTILFKDPRWRGQVAFARETVDYRIVCYASQTDQVQLHVEPIGMNLRESCANVWRSAHRASRFNFVRLNALTVTDETTSTDVTTAVAGSETARQDLMPLIVGGGLSALSILIAIFTVGSEDVGAFVLGLIPAIGVAVWSIARLLSMGGQLTWAEIPWWK